jgi:cyclopropane fatty-acyl-phospholipid synthase-like methyltransferase
MKTNVKEWQQLHDVGNKNFPESYFKSHKFYFGALYDGGFDLGTIPKYFKLEKGMTALVIGAGYGRETAVIAPAISMVYCIDVESETLLKQRAAFLQATKGITNYVNLSYQDGWEIWLPSIDFAYSFTVFQHITRDITMDYFRIVADKLKPAGRFLAQFCQGLQSGTKDVVPGLVYEPQVNWTIEDIQAAAAAVGLKIYSLHTMPKMTQAKKKFLWHWMLAGR